MDDAVREDYVREGRDPDWRMAWEALSNNSQQEVNQAVQRGEAVSRPGLRMFAVGLARRSRRYARWAALSVPFFLALNGAWIYYACLTGPYSIGWCAFYVVMAAAWGLAVPLLLIRRFRRNKRAEQLNSHHG